MTPQEWEEIKRIFHLARQQPEETRPAFLSTACSSGIVRLEVERLLFEDNRAGHFLSQPALAQSRPLFPEAFLADEFKGTPRFSVQERLGAGTFGVVYRAFDRERNSIVALKNLRQFDASHLARFKREFRSLVDLVHPNLVQLYELFGDDFCWFFSMELVQGVDFQSYVRPAHGHADWDRLRDALSQLATGVQALHSSARLHRDLKPSNVLVSNEGRVVILDFGLVKDLELHSVDQTLTLAGSPAYMAPEQASGGPLTEAVDWYAVGVMLYQALTGQLPFRGSWNDVLHRKQQEDAPPARSIAPDVPQDLEELCRRLLLRQPDLRANGTAILQGWRPRALTPVTRLQGDFVGRSTELKLLQTSFSSLSSGARQVILLRGLSGIGKTSLIEEFLNGLRHNHPTAVILHGRCRESELVPYKALDPIVDELVAYLRSLPQADAAALLPRHPALLARLFPVFGRLEALSPYTGRIAPNLEEQEIRNRAFSALREMLGRITDRTAVVISIDDLQWGDLDSVAFLAELILPVSAPALMLLLSFREEDASASPPLLLLQSFRERLKDPQSWTEIQLRGLSPDEGRDLLRRLRSNGPPLTEAQSKDILQECRGSPLLLSELLRFAFQEIEPGKKAKPAAGVLISDMIRHRASTLSSTARQLLEALSVAGEPVSRSMLYRTVNPAGEDPARAIGLLIREHLVRVTGSQEAELEPFHDQVREASLSSLSPENLRDWHSRLAQLLQSEAETDPQRLLRHYLGARNLRAAFEAALAAAHIAETALAFEQAARFYADALETGHAGKPAQANLHRKQAEALAKAGRGYEAGQSYLQAARSPEHIDAVDMRRLAAEQLIRSGYLEEGTRLFAELLRSAGIPVPSTRIKSLFRMLAIRTFIRIRGLHWRKRDEAEISPATLRKLDLLWSGAMALISIDTISGSYLQALHMLRALRAGEPSRLSLSLSFAAVYETMGGTREYEHGRKLIALAQQLADQIRDPYPSAMTYLCWAGLDFTCGRIEDGLSHCQTAASRLESASHHARSWELGTFNMVLIWFLGWGGRIRELSEKLPSILEDAQSRGDVYAEVAVRCGGVSHLVELASDNPERALAEISRTLKRWRKTSYDLPHLHSTLARTDCCLYSGRTEEARQLLLSDWPAIRKSLFTRKSQLYRVVLSYARGRTALAEWLRLPDAHHLRIEAEQYARRLSNLRSPWGAALSILLQAGIMTALQRRADAIVLLAQAEDLLRRQDLRLIAAAALRRRGELQGNAGSEQVEAADASMRSQNIVRPDRMTAMLLPVAENT